MREIDVSVITEKICEMCISANCNLNSDIYCALQCGEKTDQSPVGREILSGMLKNADIAREKQMPICQDTGMAIFFIDIGQDVHFCGGNLTDAVNEGVRLGYEKGFLRKSVVKDPVLRGNTGDNTPAVIHYNIVDGENVKITFMPKGFGSENMGGVKMLKPSDGIDGIIDFVVNTVETAGPNPCPPVVVGVGIGGTMEKAALLSKQALARSINSSNPQKYYADLENTLLEKINALGIGPQGLGGNTTALGVNVETYPTHIAGMPVAVTISCHVTRHCEAII